MAYQMLDYIYESPSALQATLDENDQIVASIVEQCRTRQVDKIILTGLGSSYTAAAMAHPLFQMHSRYPTLLINAEELGYYRERWLDAHTLVVSVSRSGERGAVIDAVHIAKAVGALAVAVTGVADSLLAQSAEITLHTREGAEVAFPKTKSVTACAAMLMRLGLAFCRAGDQAALPRLGRLQGMAPALEKTIRMLDEQIRALMPTIKDHRIVNVAGTCSNHGVALEAAIKIQEASLIPTRGDSTASLWQGPIGALNPDWLVVALVMREDLDLSRRLLTLVREFGAFGLAVCPPELDLEGLADHRLDISEWDDPYLAGLLYLPAVHLLAYHLTLARGLNPDKPQATDAVLKSILPPGRKEPD